MGGSAIRRRQLARQLRLLREAAGLRLEQAAPKLDWSTSKLSRIETGHQTVDVHGVRSMLDLYGVGGERWTELIALTRAARQRGWWRDFGVDDRGFVPLEAEASLVRTFQSVLVPGLLQTADYTRAVCRYSAFRPAGERIEDVVRIRAMRQRRLTDGEDPLELVAVVDESALRRPIGGRTVLRAQLEHLLAVAELPMVTVQVLPLATTGHAALEGSFSVLSFGELGEPDIAYVEHVNGAVHVEKEEEVSLATMAFARLRSEALSPACSVPVIERAVAETPA